MRHWRKQFVNRPLSKQVFQAVRWTRLAEELVVLHLRYFRAREKFLAELDVLADMTDSDDEEEEFPRDDEEEEFPRAD